MIRSSIRLKNALTVADRSERLRMLLPNGLTVGRLVIGLTFPFVPAAPPLLRLGLVLLAGFTDLVDGALARLLRVSSRFGQLVDPVADKAVVLMVGATLLAEGRIAWWALLLVASRDVVVIAISSYFAWRRNWAAFGKMFPRLLGKVTTGAQFLYLLAVLGLSAGSTAELAALGVAGLLSPLAAADYARQARAAVRGLKQEAAPPNATSGPR